MYILAGDIGGTNSRLIYAEVTDQGQKIVAENSYLSAGFKSFDDVLDKFIADSEMKTSINAACFAVAGPVKAGVVSVTNLPWLISEASLKKQLKTPAVKLMNDFTAIAYGVSELDEKDLVTIQPGKISKADSKCEKNDQNDAVVVGAGTGLGACHLISINGDYKPLSSEAGHASFSPQNNQQCSLMSWLWEKEKHISLESLLSGKGLIAIYRYLHEVEGVAESDDVSEQFKCTDPAKVITDNALAENDELCIKTLEIFINIYGAAAGDIVLHYYPVSMLYLAGGIAPKIKNKILGGDFLKAFLNKGLMTSNMEEIEIKLVCQEKVGLLGALAQARKLSE